MTDDQRETWLADRYRPLWYAGYCQLTEEEPVSIQIAGGNHPSTRAECLEHFRVVMAAARRAYQPNEIDEEERAAAARSLDDVVCNFVFHLTGAPPTLDELNRVLPERM